MNNSFSTEKIVILYILYIFAAVFRTCSQKLQNAAKLPCTRRISSVLLLSFCYQKKYVVFCYVVLSDAKMVAHDLINQTNFLLEYVGAVLIEIVLFCYCLNSIFRPLFVQAPAGAFKLMVRLFYCVHNVVVLTFKHPPL